MSPQNYATMNLIALFYFTCLFFNSRNLEIPIPVTIPPMITIIGFNASENKTIILKIVINHVVISITELFPIINPAYKIRAITAAPIPLKAAVTIGLCLRKI